MMPFWALLYGCVTLEVVEEVHFCTGWCGMTLFWDTRCDWGEVVYACENGSLLVPL